MRIELVFLGMLFVGPNLSEAQETTGNVEGQLRAKAAGAIVGARITATSPDLQGARQAVSAGDGVFTLLALPPGTYTLRVAAIGYRPVVIEGVQVQLGRVTGLREVPMEQAAVTLGEITITAPKVTLDPVRTTIGATLEAKDYAALPTERDYKSLITILPHINTSYHGDPANSAGSTGLENMYFIDGVNVTTPFRATGGTSLPYNFVRSVEVRAGGYEAQYGRALGAIINAVTYTGTNTFEADLFGFFTHSALSAAPKAAPVLRETGSLSYDVGGRVSGPVVRDRLWFSAAYNPRRQHADREVSSFGRFSDDRRSDVFAGKLTWHASSTTNVELSLFGDPTVHHEVAQPPADIPSYVPQNRDPFLRRLESGGVSAILRGTRTIGTALLLEASLGMSRLRENDVGETALGRAEAPYIDHVAQELSGGVHHQDIVSGRSIGGLVRATLSAGRHTAVAGVDYDESRVFRDFQATRVDRFAADSFTLAKTGFSPGTVMSRAPAAYLQDAWRVNDRLTINLGVRWSNQFFSVLGGEAGQRFTNQWQPRTGFSWQLTESGAQRLFGSVGRFYQQEPLHLSTIYYLDILLTKSYYRSDPRQPGAQVDAVEDFSTLGSQYLRSIEDAKPERFDEATLGYERSIGSAMLISVRGTYRYLNTTFQHGLDVSRCPPCWFLGTPGQGDLAFLPAPRRRYAALEVSSRGEGGRVRYLASYVLSRTWGNYVGLYNSDLYAPDPGGNFIMFVPEQAANSTGLLPNDRRHVFKASGSVRITPALLAGTSLTWQSGTPLNEFGVTPVGAPAFVVPRGSVGRTPSLLDANLRLVFASRVGSRPGPTVVLDLLHFTNSRTPVRVDQQHYFQLDAAGNQTSANPNYGQAIGFVPPRSARIGVELKF